MDRAPCRNCGFRPGNCPRGLCSACYYTPGIRNQYPTSTHFGARRGLGLGNKLAFLRPEPTDHPPGSPGKVEVLAERVRLGQMLWCDADRQECGPTTGLISEKDEPAGGREDALGQDATRLIGHEELRSVRRDTDSGFTPH